MACRQILCRDYKWSWCTNWRRYRKSWIHGSLSSCNARNHWFRSPRLRGNSSFTPTPPPTKDKLTSEKKAAKIIRSWNHFVKVVDIPALLDGQSWTTTSLRPLASWLGISRLTSKSHDLAYYHSAILITYLPTPSTGAQTIIYTPHGIPSPSLSLETLTSSGIVGVTALLHGLHEVWNPWWLGGKLNLGAHNGLQVVRNTAAKYWIGTHDEVKKGGGFVSWIMKRRVWDVEDAVKRGSGVDKMGGDLQFVTLGSGESMVLAWTFFYLKGRKFTEVGETFN